MAHVQGFADRSAVSIKGLMRMITALQGGDKSKNKKQLRKGGEHLQSDECKCRNRTEQVKKLTKESKDKNDKKSRKKNGDQTKLGRIFRGYKRSAQILEDREKLELRGTKATEAGA